MEIAHIEIPMSYTLIPKMSQIPRNGQFVPRNQNAPGNPFGNPRNGGLCSSAFLGTVPAYGIQFSTIKRNEKWIEWRPHRLCPPISLMDARLGEMHVPKSKHWRASVTGELC